MKRLTSLILIAAVYTGLIAPFGMRTTRPANAQARRGQTRTMNMENTPSGLNFVWSYGHAGAETR